MRATLAEKEASIQSLRSGALASLTSRSTIVDQRRIETAAKLWTSVVSMTPLKAAARMVQSFNMDTLIDQCSSDSNSSSKHKALIEDIWQTCGLQNLEVWKPDTSMDCDRLFVRPIVWALFQTFRQAAFFPTTQLIVAKSGAPRQAMADTTPLLEAIVQALPHHKQFVENHGSSSICFLLDELENCLFTELALSLEVWNLDESSIQQAAKILRSATEASEGAATANKPKP